MPRSGGGASKSQPGVVPRPAQDTWGMASPGFPCGLRVARTVVWVAASLSLTLSLSLPRSLSLSLACPRVSLSFSLAPDVCLCVDPFALAAVPSAPFPHGDGSGGRADRRACPTGAAPRSRGGAGGLAAVQRYSNHYSSTTGERSKACRRTVWLSQHGDSVHKGGRLVGARRLHGVVVKLCRWSRLERRPQQQTVERRCASMLHRQPL